MKPIFNGCQDSVIVLITGIRISCDKLELMQQWLAYKLFIASDNMQQHPWSNRYELGRGYFTS
jgi:hypothetical protein